MGDLVPLLQSIIKQIGRYKRDHIYWGLPYTWLEEDNMNWCFYVHFLMCSWLHVCRRCRFRNADSVFQRVPIPSHIIHRPRGFWYSHSWVVIFSISMSRNTPICTSGSRKGHGSISFDSWKGDHTHWTQLSAITSSLRQVRLWGALWKWCSSLARVCGVSMYFIFGICWRVWSTTWSVPKDSV